MSAETAAALHLVLLAAGVVTWIFAVRYHRRTFARLDPADPDLVRQGEIDVGRPSGEVRAEVIRTLRAAPTSPLGLIELEEATTDAVRGRAFPLAAAGSSRSLAFEVRLLPSGRGTGAVYRIRHDGGRSGLRTVSGLFTYLLAPAALLAAGLLVPTWVLPSEDPAVRWQVVQTVQIVHFLWPPFLFGSLYRRSVGIVERVLRSAVRNAAFGPDEA